MQNFTDTFPSPTTIPPPPPHFGEVRLLIQYQKHSHGLLADEIQTGLVVLVADSLPADALCSVLCLFQGKDVLVEVELKLFVGKVDAELLKAVHFKVLQSGGGEEYEGRGQKGV